MAAAKRLPTPKACTSSTLFMASHSSVYSSIGTLTRGNSTFGRSMVIGRKRCSRVNREETIMLLQGSTDPPPPLCMRWLCDAAMGYTKVPALPCSLL